MDLSEFLSWTDALAEEGWLSPRQVEDVRAQRALFDRDRALLERELPGAFVGYVAEERLVNQTATGLLTEAEALYDGRRQLYFESVPFPVERSHEGPEMRSVFPEGRAMSAPAPEEAVAEMAVASAASDLRWALSPALAVLALVILAVVAGLLLGGPAWVRLFVAVLGLIAFVTFLVRRIRERRRSRREKVRERSR